MLERLSIQEAGRRREEISAEFLDSPEDFSVEALKARSWMAVPVRDNISDDQAVGIAQGAAALGAKTAIAIATEPAIDPEIWTLSLSAADIVAFDANCMLRAFLLLSDNRTFALLEEGDYYFVLAGPKTFLEVSLGAPVEISRQLFLSYAERPQWPPATRAWLLGVYHRYCL